MARISRRNRTRRIRLASPYFRGVQDAFNGDGYANPYREDTHDERRYDLGYQDGIDGELTHLNNDDFLLPPDYNPT